MRRFVVILSMQKVPPDIHIRTELKAGDIGYVIYLHGWLYQKEYGYGLSFEAYVAQGLYEFYKNYDAQKDAVWICEHEDRIVGFLLLMHRKSNAAQLRYFLLLPEYRSVGLGKRLMDLFMKQLKEKEYSVAYLWTTNEQEAAAALYKKYGFELAEEAPSTAFGKALTEQKYVLKKRLPEDFK
jgi:ribosomal protein S18 acetylase RimI-like enzyme